MSVGNGNLAYSEIRREPRDDVHYRARAVGVGDTREHALLIVNLSPGGLMARCESCFEVGNQIRIQLPGVGMITAQIRWALGGRLGAEFVTPIGIPKYYELIAGLSPKK